MPFGNQYHHFTNITDLEIQNSGTIEFNSKVRLIITRTVSGRISKTKAPLPGFV